MVSGELWALVEYLKLSFRGKYKYLYLQKHSKGITETSRVVTSRIVVEDPSVCRGVRVKSS